MTLSGRDEYSTSERQKGKEESIERSKEKVRIVKKMLEETALFTKVIEYESKEVASYLGRGAPAVQVDTPAGKRLAIAPDLKCKLQDETLWVEVKDKPQRYLFPDTGCDIHEYVGYWSVNRYNHEAVLMLFIDPRLDEKRIAKYDEWRRNDIKKRWRLFMHNDSQLFYGNWLNVLAEYDGKKRYPLCSLERSRDIPMNIVYMDVYKMQSFQNIKSLADFLQSHSKAIDAPDFRVFYKEAGKVVTDPEPLMPSPDT